MITDQDAAIPPESQTIPPTLGQATVSAHAVTPGSKGNMPIGEEATQVQVAVSETCTAIAYDAQELNAQATRLLALQAAKTVGKGYMLYGNVKVSVTQATTQPTTSVVFLSFTCQGTYMYQLNANMQQRIVHLIAGEPRLTALHQLERLPGIHTVHISGIADNQQIPIDAARIHLFIILTVF